MKQYLFAVLLLGLVVGGYAGVDSLQFNYDTVANKVNANQPQYRTASIHAHMVWSDDNSEQDFAASIRIMKDSLIWMSLSGAMGVEGARILITPDSFRIINKTANEYSVHGFNYVRAWLLFPVNFQMLQALFTGGEMNIGEPAAHGIGTEGNIPVLYTETAKLREKLWVDSLSYTIQKILLKDKLVNQEMTVNFGDYKKTDGKLFSYNRDIEVSRNTIVTRLTIIITRLHWNEELTYPFEISEKYKRVDDNEPPNR